MSHLMLQILRNKTSEQFLARGKLLCPSLPLPDLSPWKLRVCSQFFCPQPPAAALSPKTSRGSRNRTGCPRRAVARVMEGSHRWGGAAVSGGQLLEPRAAPGRDCAGALSPPPPQVRPDSKPLTSVRTLRVWAAGLGGRAEGGARPGAPGAGPSGQGPALAAPL